MKYLIGIRPTGKLHLGHLLGPISSALDLQEQGEDVTFLVAQMHAPECSFDDVRQLAQELDKLGAYQIVQQYSKTVEYFMSLLPKAKVGELRRIPSFRDKGKTAHDLLYPVLMAADIETAGADAVIVGHDQLAHIEFASKLLKRNIKTVVGSLGQVQSIADPSKKMSKSLGDKHCLYLFDDPHRKMKIKRAPTTPEGIENLRRIGDFLGVAYTDRMAEYKERLIEALDESF